jgi:hypothetical protein
MLRYRAAPTLDYPKESDAMLRYRTVATMEYPRESEGVESACAKVSGIKVMFCA